MIKLIFWLLAAATLQASSWNEAVQGDLSDNGAAPTQLVFEPGENLVYGTAGKDLPQDPVDRDIFTFTIAPGYSLTSINFLVFEPTNQSFYAIAPGTSINTSNPATHLSNTLVNATGEFINQLALGSYSGGTGLTVPVGPGTYTIWFQELSSVVTYKTAYTVVPEPSTASLLLASLAFGFQLLRRRNRVF